MLRFVGTDGLDAARFMRGVGDLWLDTGTTPPTLRVCVAVSPVRFRAMVQRSALAAPDAPATPSPIQPPPPAPDDPALMPAYVNSFLLPALRVFATVVRDRQVDMRDALKQLLDAARDAGLAT